MGPGQRFLHSARGRHPVAAAALLPPIPGRARLPVGGSGRADPDRHRRARIWPFGHGGDPRARPPPGDLRRVMLTHFHEDHAGSAADIAAWGEVEVLAHRA